MKLNIIEVNLKFFRDGKRQTYILSKRIKNNNRAEDFYKAIQNLFIEAKASGISICDVEYQLLEFQWSTQFTIL